MGADPSPYRSPGNARRRPLNNLREYCESVPMRLQARDASRAWPLEAAERAVPGGRHGDGLQGHWTRAPTSAAARPPDRPAAESTPSNPESMSWRHGEAPAEPGEPAARARTQRRSASPRRGGTPRGAARTSGGDGGNRTPVRRWCNRTSPGAVRWRFSQPRRLTRTRTPTGSVTWMFRGPR